MNWDIKNIIVILMIILIVPGSLWAKDYEDKALITYKGKPGYFFSEEVGDQILFDLAQFKKLKTEKIPALELKIKWLRYDVVLHKRNIEYSDQIAEKSEEALKESEALRMSETKSLREQLDHKFSWYNRPATVFIIGFVVGGALVVGLTFGLQETR